MTPPSPPSSNGSGNTATARQMTIVYVEDTDQIRDIVRNYLTQFLGYRVVEAATGWDGLKCIQTERPELVILDWNLPDINGLQLYQAMRAHPLTSRIPVIMLSAVDETREKALEDGITSFLLKPIDFDLLSKEIAGILGDVTKPTRDTGLLSAKAAPAETETQVARQVKRNRELGRWYEETPEHVLPILATAPHRAWARLLTRNLHVNRQEYQARAVIALSLWHRQDDAPYALTEGQRHFWGFIRHSLASSNPRDAMRRWYMVAPLAAAMMNTSIEGLNKSVRSVGARSKVWQCRQWALETLMRNRYSGTGVLAERGLQDTNVEVRATAARVLQRVGNERHVVPLTHSLNDSVASVREQAAIALAEIALLPTSTEMAAVALELALLEGHESVAQSAAHAFTLIGNEQTVGVLLTATQDRNEASVLREVAHALGKLQMRHPRCQPALLRLSLHADETVRQAAELYLKDQQGLM